MLRKHKILWLRIYAKVNYVLFFIDETWKEKLASRRRNQGNIPHEIFATHCYPHCVVLNIDSPFEIREYLHGLQLLANERLAAAPWTRGIFRSNGACFSTSLLGLRYLHKSWCNCRERWLAGITEIRNDEAREVECRRETGWCWVAGHYLSPLFYVYSWGWQEQLFWRWDTDCRVSLK